MDPFLNAHCSISFDAVMKSPMGQCCIEYFESFMQDYEPIFPLSFIKNKLNKNEYKSPEEFLDSVRNIFTESARNINSNSEIGYCLETLVYLLEKKIKNLMSFNNSVFNDAVAHFSDVIHESLDEFPDNLTEFEEKIKGSKEQQKLKIIQNEKQDNDEQIDPDDLYKQVSQLTKDSEISDVISIIINYEKAYSHESDVLQVDFSKCQSHTLKLIKDYLEKINENSEN